MLAEAGITPGEAMCGRDIQDVRYGFPRIHLLGFSVNKEFSPLPQ
jgi:hypothetical protein